MVFHFRCFSFLLEEYETRTQTKSTATFYTAASDFNRSVPNSHAKTLQVEKRSNLRVFTFAELKAATKDFGMAIGKGGFGSVYKGVIKSLEPPFDEIQVAVKRSHIYLQDRKEWEAEINVLGVVEHPNLVKLIGYCEEKNKRSSLGSRLLLVYEYMVNGSVKDHLYAKSETPLSWNMRLKMAQDAARGLVYLHEEMDVQIVLRDFKPSNILLDDQWNAKLSDFGLAQLHPQVLEQTHHTTMVKGLGTEGYIAPEYFTEGRHTSKSDVWSYGVFLYELITGRRPLDLNRPRNQLWLLKWVEPYIESKRYDQIVDPRLEGNYPLEAAEKLSIVAEKCVSLNPKSRPNMSEVLELVNQLIVVPSQATSFASPQVPQVAVNPNKAFVGPNQGERTNENSKHEGQKVSMKIQGKKLACLPMIHPLKLLKSCSKKGCCASLR